MAELKAVTRRKMPWKGHSAIQVLLPATRTHKVGHLSHKDLVLLLEDSFSADNIIVEIVYLVVLQR